MKWNDSEGGAKAESSQELQSFIRQTSGHRGKRKESKHERTNS